MLNISIISGLAGEDADYVPHLEGIVNTVLRKDVINRNAFRNPVALDAVTRYMFDNIGNLTSIRNIASVLKAEGVSMDASSLEDYVSALCGAKMSAEGSSPCSSR